MNVILLALVILLFVSSFEGLEVMVEGSKVKLHRKLKASSSKKQVKTAEGVAPTAEPTAEPTQAPTILPTLEPTAEPTAIPTAFEPTSDAPTTAMPTTHVPTVSPTTHTPTVAPTTEMPTTHVPTTTPTTHVPTLAPTTAMPTTSMPTTSVPTSVAPTTAVPTLAPTTSVPTTSYPTTSVPTTLEPTFVPTPAPTDKPSRNPTRKPTLPPIPSDEDILEFETQVTLSGYPSGTVTSDNITATQNATAESMETPFNTLFPVGTDSEPEDRRRRRLNFVSVSTEVTKNEQEEEAPYDGRMLQELFDVTFNFQVIINVDDTDFDNEDDLFDFLTENLDEAVDDGDFLQFLEEATEAQGFTLPGTVAVEDVDYEFDEGDDKKKKDDDNNDLSDGDIAAIVICSVFGFAVLVFVIYYVYTRFVAEGNKDRAFTARGSGGGSRDPEQQGILNGAFDSVL